jgi:hypothetical protein
VSLFNSGRHWQEVAVLQRGELTPGNNREPGNGGVASDSDVPWQPSHGSEIAATDEYFPAYGFIFNKCD